MPVSENSFEDKIGRATLLKEACAGFSPAFAPAGTDLTVAAQVTLLTTLGNCCTNVSTALVNLKDQTDPRAASVVVIKARATRALGRVESNLTWATKLPNVKAAADKLRAMTVPKPVLPPAPSDPDAPVPPKRDAGGQSYKDVEGQLFKFISSIAKCSSYDTGCPVDITIAAFTTLYTTLKTANETIPALEVDLQEVRVDRLRRFEGKKPLPDGTTSLRDRMKRVKKAVGSQYGRSSSEFTLVSGIKY